MIAELLGNAADLIEHEEHQIHTQYAANGIHILNSCSFEDTQDKYQRKNHYISNAALPISFHIIIRNLKRKHTDKCKINKLRIRLHPK